MNYRMISKILGRVMAVEAALMVPPALTAVYYGESPLPFVYTLLIAAALFALLTLPKLRHHDIYAREGFVSVALSWLLMSLVGALPFVFSGEMPNYCRRLLRDRLRLHHDGRLRCSRTSRSSRAARCSGAACRTG